MISGKSFAEIRTVIRQHRAQLIKIVKRFRQVDVLAEYDQNRHTIDEDADQFVRNWAENCVAVETMKDHNCLYGSVSLNLFGSEKKKTRTT